MSSYSTTKVIVDNPVLLIILQKYKDMGLFGGQEKYEGVGCFTDTATIGIGTMCWDDPNYTNTPAFYFSGDQNDEYSSERIDDGFDPPKSLDEVLGSILYVLNCAEEYLDGQILEKLRAELEQRKDEINLAYSRVYWKSITTDYSVIGQDFCKFEYDPVNGGTYMWKSDEIVPKSEIAIDNPVLLEILQKYEKMGLKPFFGIGRVEESGAQWAGEFGSAERVCDEYRDLFKMPAFYYYQCEEVDDDDPFLPVKSCPETLKQVLDGLITVMENGIDYLNEQVFTLLKEELNQRRGEINQAYSRVYWYYEKITYHTPKPYSPDPGFKFFVEKFEYAPDIGEVLSKSSEIDDD